MNSLGLGPFELADKQPQYVGMRYAGLTREECAALNRPPAPPPCPPMPPRRLPAEVVEARLRDVEQGLGRLERATNRGNADTALLIAELRGALQLLSGEYAGILRDIQSGKDLPRTNIPLDTSFFARLKKSRVLLLDLCVADHQFLDTAQAVFKILRAWWPKEQISSETRSVAGES